MGKLIIYKLKNANVEKICLYGLENNVFNAFYLSISTLTQINVNNVQQDNILKEQ